MTCLSCSGTGRFGVPSPPFGHGHLAICPRHPSIRSTPAVKPVRLPVLLLGLLMLAACAGNDTYVPKAEPSFYRNLAQPGAELDAAAAASMISGFRANNGLPAV